MTIVVPTWFLFVTSFTCLCNLLDLFLKWRRNYLKYKSVKQLQKMADSFVRSVTK